MSALEMLLSQHMLIGNTLSLFEDSTVCVFVLHALVIVEDEGCRLVERLDGLNIDDIYSSYVLLGGILLFDLKKEVILLGLVSNEPKLLEL